jgi:hypothetical protein
MTAEAMPARSAPTADMAMVLIGVPHSPMPAPSRAKFHQIAPMPVPRSNRSNPSVARPATTRPASMGQRSPNRPTSRPDALLAAA